MRDDRQFIIDMFHKVKNEGYVRSDRKNDTGIGKTFEDRMKVIENNRDEPDLAGYEIKSHRDKSNSYTTLFTKAPDFPKKANVMLNINFGTPYNNAPDLNRLHTSMFASKFNTYEGKYSFRIINDRNAKVLKIGVYDINEHQLINDTVGYNYSTIETILKRKLKKLFYVSAERRFEDGCEEFYFNHAEIYTEPSLECFLGLIDKGLIMYDIRMGCYKSGIKRGKPHDHGSGFRMLESNFCLLYKDRKVVD